MRKVVFLAAFWATPALSQQASDRGALLILNGSDTVVVDRFIRIADTLKGTVQVKAQPRIQGATDRQVPVDQAEKLAALIRAGGNKDVTVHVFPSTNHLFISDPSGDFNNYDKLPTNKVGADILGTLADWLAAKLVARVGRS